MLLLAATEDHSQSGHTRTQRDISPTAPTLYGITVAYCRIGERQHSQEGGVPGTAAPRGRCTPWSPEIQMRSEASELHTAPENNGAVVVVVVEGRRKKGGGGQFILPIRVGFAPGYVLVKSIKCRRIAFSDA